MVVHPRGDLDDDFRLARVETAERQRNGDQLPSRLGKYNGTNT